MGYDHAEQKEIDPNASTSGSSSAHDIEKPRDWEDTDGEDTIGPAPGYDAMGPSLKRSETHTFGKLRLRADDDNDPQIGGLLRRLSHS